MSILGRHISWKWVALLAFAMIAVAGLLPVMTKGQSREIVLVAKNMSFYLEGDSTPNPELAVKPGEPLRIVLKNEDRGMIHDFAVPGIHAATDAIGWNEQVVVTFDAPEKPGTYEYICRPHLLMMKGTLHVVK